MAEKVRKIIKKYSLLIPVYCRCITRRKRIFLFYTPVHTNMGDHAIRKGELLYFKKFFPEYKLIEINERLYCKLTEKNVEKILKKDDLIVLHGGGYIGDLWIEGEKAFKHIVESFPDNKIAAFPNTAYYSDTESGNKLLEEDRAFYETHKNVRFYLRDMRSYKLMSKLVGENRCSYKPDMALILTPEYRLERNKILMCLRSDCEKVQSSESFGELKKQLESDGYCVEYNDTLANKDGYFFKRVKKVREKSLEEKIREFAGAKLVITDRLHGMILSAITGTPCAATDNISKKVSGVYEWIKHLDYVKVMKFEDIDADVIEELLRTKPVYDNSMIMEEFAEMTEEIKNYREK